MNLCVMVSGSGSNLQALINATEDGTLTSRISVVVSNRKAAYGLQRAQNAGIPTMYFPLKPYSDEGRSREEYEADLATALLPYRPVLIVLAGWMHVFTPTFLDAFPRQVINLHPALPGAFDGAFAIERAYEAYLRGEIAYSGCMIHYVIPEVDAGEVILKTIVPIEPEDTLADFELRMHTAEHQLIVDAIRLLEESGEF